MIETLDDIVENLANSLGIYGAHDDDAECGKKPMPLLLDIAHNGTDSRGGRGR